MKSYLSSDLSAFLAVARHLSFRKAATELGVTPSALSHSLRAWEERLQLRLFNRTTRSVALSEAGAALYEKLTPAAQLISIAFDELNQFRGRPTGTLRLNAARAPARQVVMPIVSRFMAAYPHVRVELVTDNALVDMVAGGFDAGVRFGEIVAADMIAVPIGPRQRSAIVASPAFFETYPRPLNPRDLRRLPCIRYRFDDGRYYTWEFERDDESLGIEVDGPVSLSDTDLMIDAAVAGHGLAYVFEAEAEPHLRTGKLVRVLEDWCPDYPGFFLYYPSRRQMPTPLRVFIDFIRTAV